MFYRFIGIFMIVFGFGAGLVAAQDDYYSGKLGSSNPSDDYRFILQAGESVLITAEAVSGDLDTVVKLVDPSGAIVGENDDQNDDSLDSALGFTASVEGTYVLTVSRYDGVNNGGDYRLHIAVGDDTVLEPLIELTTLRLSGPQELINTEHFRIHYTLRGDDATTVEYAQAVADTMEEVWHVQIEELGWPAPISDGSMGGSSQIDVYLTNLLGSGSGAMGVSRPGDLYGDNPATVAIEEYASYGLMELDNDFVEIEGKEYDPIKLMRTTAAHEFNHLVQFGFDANDPDHWYFEATASWSETNTFPKDQDATGYVDYSYEYPELCLGSTSDPSGGLLMYGEWMFMQSLADAYGRNVIQELWANIAETDGYTPLENTIAAYDETLPQAVARYRLQNVARDYKFATFLDDDAILWLEDNINRDGRYAPTSDGVQELGANYYAIDMSGSVDVSLVGDNGRLELWVLGVHGTEDAEAFRLGRTGTVDTTGYDHTYLMVFNPDYNDSPDDCSYVNYTLRVASGTGTMPTSPDLTFNARYFLPLKP